MFFFIPADRGKLKFTRYDIPKTDHKLCTLQVFEEDRPKHTTNPNAKPTFHNTLLENKIHKDNITKLIMDHESTSQHELDYTSLINKLMKYSKDQTRTILKPHEQRIGRLEQSISQAEARFDSLNQNQKKKYLRNIQALRNEIEAKDIKLNKLRDSKYQNFGETGSKQYIRCIKQKAQ